MLPCSKVLGEPGLLAINLFAVKRNKSELRVLVKAGKILHCLLKYYYLESQASLKISEGASHHCIQQGNMIYEHVRINEFCHHDS